MLKSFFFLLIFLFALSSQAEPKSDFATLIPLFTAETQVKMERLRPNQSESPDCQEGVSFLQSRLAYGQYQATQDFYLFCRGEELGAETWYLLALGFTSLFQWEKADLSFSQSVQMKKDPGVLFTYADFLWSQSQSEKALSVLSLFDDWEAELAFAAIEKLRQKSTERASYEEIDRFLKEWQQSGDSPIMRERATLTRAGILAQSYEHLESLKSLQSNFSHLPRPDLYFKSGFISFYGGASPYVSYAGDLYRSFVKYTHRFSWLPVEQNVHNYYQLYTSICKDSLLEKSQRKELAKKKSQWIKGDISAADFLNFLEQLNQRFPEKADVLSHLGGMHEILGDDEKGFSYLWKSRQLCSYYNRAHRGIVNINLRKRNRSFPDYEQLLAAVDESLAGKTFDPKLSQYILNWQSLGEEAQKRVKFSLLIWRPYVSWLYEKGNRAFIKYSFQLLSESPKLGEIRDTRIRYKNDWRLWDDVRGLGGQTVVAEYDEVMEYPFGAYGLLTHEVAHQFHQALPAYANGCIDALYLQAKKRNKFPDSYAARNNMEYFAQGATYWVIPENAPKRFGTNRGWVLRNDRDLGEWLEQIEKGIAVDELRCPIEVPMSFQQEPFPEIIPALKIDHGF